MSHHKVEVKNLSHTYPDGTVALKDVSFLIHHGESVAIIGANGAGKSTLLLHLNGYLNATSGQIGIGDVWLEKETLAEIRRTVGMVFQDPDDQLFMPTVFDDVAFGPLRTRYCRRSNMSAFTLARDTPTESFPSMVSPFRRPLMNSVFRNKSIPSPNGKTSNSIRR